MSLWAGVPSASFSANVLGIRGDGDNSYVGLLPGDDMLPYTDDDVEGPTECANFGGTWGFAHMDHNADNVVDENEPFLHTVRVGPEPGSTAGDDDVLELSALTRPEYGVLYESEDWAGYWASGEGPNGCRLAEATGYDFEINDHRDWDAESNAYVYNNLGYNQHGLGLRKYRLDCRTDPLPGQSFVYDEIEGWRKSFAFRNNTDDPATEFDERGGCRRFYRAPSSEVDIRGYMIPVEDLPGLERGDLPSLFDWETVDLAEYFRDTIGPLLEDEDLEVWNELFANGAALEDVVPPTHVLLLQSVFPLDLAQSEATWCSDGTEVQHAAYWGILPDGSSVMRMSALLGLKAGLTETLDETIHPFVDVPDDGVEANLWVQDHFWRDDPEHLGRYATSGEGTWRIIDDPSGRIVDDFFGDGTSLDQLIVSSDAGALSAPLPRGLSSAEAPIMVVADLAVDATGGPLDGASFQIIARSGDDVVAYADISEEGSQVHLGGTFVPADGTASAPDSSGPEGLEGMIAEIDTDNLDARYTRFVLIVSRDGARVLQLEHDEYDVKDFTGLADYDELAGATGAVDFGAGVTHVTIGGNDKTAMTTLLVFASPGVGPFLRGDCNQDGRVDLSDGVAALGFLFLGDETPGCLASCLANGGPGAVDLSAAVYLFNYLFLGGDPLPPPSDVAGYSQNPADANVTCDSYDPQ